MLALAAINTHASLLPLAYSGYPLAAGYAGYAGYPLAYAPRISLSQGVAGLSYASYAPVPLAYSAQAVPLPAPVVSPVVAAPLVPSA